MDKQDFNVIKDSEELDESKLSEIAGGEDSDNDCTCDCWIGNTNSGGKYQKYENRRFRSN